LCSVPSNEGRAEVTHDIMDINKILSKLFGNKSSRDMKAIQPWVEKIKAAYPAIQALDNDGLRAKTKEWQEKIQHSADDIKEKIEALKAKVEETPIEDREVIFNQIDKLETQVLDKMEEALNEALPEVLAIVKEV
jgi:preprotein translocase subunit SecA